MEDVKREPKANMETKLVMLMGADVLSVDKHIQVTKKLFEKNKFSLYAFLYNCLIILFYDLSSELRTFAATVARAQ